VCEVEETTRGKSLIAMGYYNGKSNRQWIERRPFKVKEALENATQIAGGLKQAHEHWHYSLGYQTDERHHD